MGQVRSVDSRIWATDRERLRSLTAAMPRDVVRIGKVWLASLPMAAAILIDDDDRVLLAGRNEAFVEVRRKRPNLLDPGERIGIAVRAALSGPDGGTRSFRWNDGDAVSGRHFEVRLHRIDVALGMRSCLLSLVDRTTEAESTRSLRAELSHDSLTGLPNRSTFIETVESIVGDSGRHAVLLVDLARFSRINESLGATAGDEAIISVARRLLSTVRAGDLIARVGGDEFGLLVRINARRDAVAAARRVRAVLARPLRLSSTEIGLECAVGCALSGEADVGGEDLVRQAQIALKRAKASGGIEVHRSDERAGRQGIDIETELRRAIGSGGLALAFQPIVRLADRQLVGFEALARWEHPDRGVIEPAEFIAVAEQTGLIVPLGRWALDRALATLAGWDRAAGRRLPITLSVNVSPIQLVRDDVAAAVAAGLTLHDIDGARLTVELTESAIVQDPTRTTRALRALKALDVRIAMDDFGTGYSNLAHLRRLPIDILKIDQSFVSGMTRDRDKLAIVRAVLGLAEALGKDTTAEGIDTLEVGRSLAALGCVHGQGFCYGVPLSPDEAFSRIPT